MCERERMRMGGFPYPRPMRHADRKRFPQSEQSGQGLWARRPSPPLPSRVLPVAKWWAQKFPGFSLSTTFMAPLGQKKYLTVPFIKYLDPNNLISIYVLMT